MLNERERCTISRSDDKSDFRINKQTFWKKLGSLGLLGMTAPGTFVNTHGGMAAC